jgi:hypothetical protein
VNNLWIEFHENPIERFGHCYFTEGFRTFHFLLIFQHCSIALRLQVSKPVRAAPKTRILFSPFKVVYNFHLQVWLQ